MVDIADTAFSNERELIVCSFLQVVSKGKGSSLPIICNAPTAFFVFVFVFVFVFFFFVGKNLGVTTEMYFAHRP